MSQILNLLRNDFKYLQRSTPSKVLNRYYTRPIEGVYSNVRKSHSKSLRDGIFVVKLGFFAKKTLLRIVAKNASNFVPV